MDGTRVNLYPYIVLIMFRTRCRLMPVLSSTIQSFLKHTMEECLYFVSSSLLALSITNLQCVGMSSVTIGCSWFFFPPDWCNASVCEVPRHLHFALSFQLLFRSNCGASIGWPDTRTSRKDTRGFLWLLIWSVGELILSVSTLLWTMICQNLLIPTCIG